MAEFQALAKAKELYERAHARLGKFRAENERTISRALQAVETAGAAGGWGYANARWGTASTADAHTLPEIQVVGIPADLAVGVGLLGVSFFGGLGKYDEHGFNLGSGSAAAFAYRMGHELGSKAQHTQARTTSRGAPPQMTAGRGPHGGRIHTYVEDREREAA
jgi:hypothetical protein